MTLTKNTRLRLIYLVIAVILALLAGFSTRTNICPTKMLNLYTDMILTAGVVYFVSRIIVPFSPRWKNFLFVFLLLVVLEVSQLYHASWIDTLRVTSCGGAVLGHQFSVSDLVCYTLGSLVGWLVDWAATATGAGAAVSSGRKSK